MFGTYEADLRVIGVGGGGGNALRELRRLGTARVARRAANTDRQALAEHPDEERLVLGPRATRGLGAGGRPSVGYAAAQESRTELQEVVAEADLVFLAAGLGGGTGTGATPLIAHLARDAGALTVAVVTLPFAFEGGRRRVYAEQGLAALKEQTDCLIVVPNDRLLLAEGGEEPTFLEAFARADRVLADAVRGISDLVVQPGLVNLDFADVRAVLTGGGRAVMGIGVGRGADRALAAIGSATRSPLLADDSFEGARGVLLQFTIDPGVSLSAIHQAAERVHAMVDDDAEILFGVAGDPNLESEVHVTLIASGLPHPDPAAVLSPARRLARIPGLEQLTPAEVVLARPRRRSALGQ
ncbi:MAG: cell division protein FtsZ [Sandaracinaceae bacterium]